MMELKLSLTELDLCSSCEVAGGKELLARQVSPGEERLCQSGHGGLCAQLLEGQPQSDAVDLGHAAGHPAKLGLLVHLVAVSRIDALKLSTVPAKQDFKVAVGDILT